MTKNQKTLIAPKLPSIIQVTDQEGFSKRDTRKARKGNFEEIIKSQYKNMYRIVRNDFSFLDKPQQNSKLELLAEFDNISGDFTEFNGWLQTRSKKTTDYTKTHYARLSLIPVKTPDGLIYHFKGSLEWSNGAYGDRTAPISIIPIYGVPSGKIIELKPADIGDSWIFEKVKVEYRSLDLRLGEE